MRAGGSRPYQVSSTLALKKGVAGGDLCIVALHHLANEGRKIQAISGKQCTCTEEGGGRWCPLHCRVAPPPQ